MKFYNNDSMLSWFEFPILQPHTIVQHACYTRLHGTSVNPYHSLNISNRVGDDPIAVSSNIQSIVDHFQKRSKAPALYIDMQQVHGRELKLIHSTEEALSMNSSMCDAIATVTPGIILTVQHADCLPILLFDPITRVIAAIHAGWRGVAQKITSHVIENICATWRVDPANLIACIGPSIGPNDMEFKNWEEELPPFLHKYIDCRNTMLDLWQASIDELMLSGLHPFHIACTDISTYTRDDLFFSYRREKRTGRNATSIMLIDTNSQ